MSKFAGSGPIAVVVRAGKQMRHVLGAGEAFGIGEMLLWGRSLLQPPGCGVLAIKGCVFFPGPCWLERCRVTLSKDKRSPRALRAL